MPGEEPVQSRTFTRGGRPGRGRGGSRRGGGGRRREPAAGGPQEPTAGAGPDGEPAGGARPRPQRRPRPGPGRGRAGSGCLLPADGAFSEPVLAFFNGAVPPPAALPAALLPDPVTWAAPHGLQWQQPYVVCWDGAQYQEATNGGHQYNNYRRGYQPSYGHRGGRSRQYGEYRDSAQHDSYRDCQQRYRDRSDNQQQYRDRSDGQQQNRDRWDGQEQYRDRPDNQQQSSDRPDSQQQYRDRPDSQQQYRDRPDGQEQNRDFPESQEEYKDRSDGQQQYKDRSDGQQQYRDRSEGQEQYRGRSDGQQQYRDRPNGHWQYGDFGEPGRRQRGRRGTNRQHRPLPEQKTGSVVVQQPSTSEADLGQRERMVEQLTFGRYECLVCVDPIRQPDPVWNCVSCFHVFHMLCIRRWAKSSKAESGGWRCPACQNVSPLPPTTYKCFCGKVRDPPWNRRDTPHSCGEVCGRSRTDVSCTHRCTLLCHPGPCPPCAASVKRSCPCGKKTVDIKCDLASTMTCGDTCGRTLNCGAHTCDQPCHVGDCGACEVRLELACFCGKVRREEVCTAETAGAAEFCCGDTCGRPLSCGRHHCDKLCHEGDCGDCPLSPALVERCPCGARLLSELAAPARADCSEPVPTCGGVCRRRLRCGPPSEPHTCQAACHAGPCPPCPRQTAVRCRCGFMDCQLPCAELTTRADDARCQKRCTKKRSCGRHKCGQECCILAEHPCPLVCGRKLNCGQHSCDQPCHVGQCRPCLQASFEELFCECGASVLYPPVQCGTRPPPCDQPCPRQHPCGHPVLHNCHSMPECPPCTQLMKKTCYGGHEERSSVPCHQTAVSCGRPCGARLPCQRHKCKEPCHAGPCPEAQSGCRQPCEVPRPGCKHPCGAPCHDQECPNTPCKTKVRVTCECGHRSRTLACGDTGSYHALNTSLIAHKLSAIQAGGATVDVSELVSGAAGAKNGRTRALQCNAECAIMERNRRLAEALQIRNPELSGKVGPPAYPPSMLEMARRAKGLAEDVHKQLTDLVQLAQQSKQKSRSVAFAPMNRERRQFIHEYCEHFGCESESYDEEPKRNVVATAYRDRCWLPTLSVLQVVERETGPRTIAPAPLLAARRDPAAASVTKPKPEPPKESAREEPTIDYFDFTG